MTVRIGLMGRAAAALVGAALISYAPAAQASTYDFSGFTSAAGLVILDITIGASDGSSPSNGGFFITSVTGTVLGQPVELAQPVGTATPPSFLTSSDGEWYYDNVLYPNLTSPYGTAFDNPGLLLEYIGTGTLINIFSPGSVAPYTLGQSPNQQQQDLFPIGVGLSATTPLPSTWTMLIAGFAGLGYFAFRGSKKSSAIAAA